MRHPGSARAFRLGIVVAAMVVGGTILSACGGPEEPTVVQAEAALKADINGMAKLVRAEDFQVIDAGGKDIPCAGGRARRTYEVSGVMALKSDDRTASLGVLTQNLDDHGYKFVKSNLDIPTEEFVNQVAHTKLVATTSTGSRFKVTGETGCLDLE